MPKNPAQYEYSIGPTIRVLVLRGAGMHTLLVP